MIGPPSLTDLLNLLPPKPRTVVGYLIGCAIPIAVMLASGGNLTWQNVVLTLTGGYASRSLARADSSKSAVKETDNA